MDEGYRPQCAEQHTFDAACRGESEGSRKADTPKGPSDMERCPECTRWESRGATFCKNCGNLLGPRISGKGNDGSSVLYVSMVICAILFSITIVSALVYDCTHFRDVVESVEPYGIPVYIPLGLDDVTLFWITGNGLYVLFLIELAFIAASFTYAIVRFCRRRWETPDDRPKLTRTGLGATSTILAVCIACSIAYFAIMALIGLTPDVSWMEDMDQNEMAFRLTNAGFSEEMEYRVLLMGLPMMVISGVWLSDKGCWKCLLGGFGTTRIGWILVIISSVMFGLAHESGWGWVKILDAFASGVLLGYVYMEYGLYASVLIHTANDMTGAVTWIFGGVTGSLSIIGLILMGFVIIVLWIIRPNKGIMDVRKMEWIQGSFPSLKEQWGRHRSRIVRPRVPAVSSVIPTRNRDSGTR